MADPGRPSVTATHPQPGAADASRHAAQLLEQADQLVRLASEMRREAQRLDSSLAISARRASGSSEPDVSSRTGTMPAPDEPSPPRQRRFAPASERLEVARSEIDRHADDLQAPDDLQISDEGHISDGLRLLITGMAITGSSREELLELMRVELGYEHPEAILDSLNL
jgi:hypothetical protein